MEHYKHPHPNAETDGLFPLDSEDQIKTSVALLDSFAEDDRVEGMMAKLASWKQTREAAMAPQQKEDQQFIKTEREMNNMLLAKVEQVSEETKQVVAEKTVAAAELATATSPLAPNDAEQAKFDNFAAGKPIDSTPPSQYTTAA